VTDLGEVRSWLFKSLAVESTLTEMEQDGVAIRSATDPTALQRVLPLEDFSSEIRMQAMSNLPAYLAFFCLENAVRELIGDRMTEQHGPGWWATEVGRAIQEKVTSRRDKEGANRWHSRRGATEIYYTDFGDLALIIQNRWSDFSDLFPDVAWITSRLRELEQSRNVIAHNNVLDKLELDRIRMYLTDWLRQVG
jgi:Swt1-like HEPN